MTQMENYHIACVMNLFDKLTLSEIVLV